MIPMYDTPLEKLLTTCGSLYKFKNSMVPLHHNANGLSKSIDFETGLLLANFVQYYKPQTIVELGTFQGYSTSWLILGSHLAGGPDGPYAQVHAFEVFKERSYGPMWYETLGLRLDYFTYHEIPGGIWNFPGEVPEQIDLLFHDTQHLPGPTQKEFDLLLPRISVGGIVLVDDMIHPDYRPMQNYVVDTFTKDHTLWKFEVLRLGHGLGIAERLA
jgi:hypothetical protein